MHTAVNLPDAWAPSIHDVPTCGCFGCRIDVLGQFDSGETGIVEIKTGKKIQPTHLIQLDAQVHCAIENRLTNGNERGILLQLLPDTYKVYERPDTHWKLIQSAARVAQWKLRNGAKLSEDGPHALRRADGIRVPGIGTVLALSGMVDLSGIPQKVLDLSSERGSKVHEMVQWDVELGGRLDESAQPAWMVPYLDQWRRFCEREGFTPKQAEVVAVHHCDR